LNENGTTLLDICTLRSAGTAQTAGLTDVNTTTIPLATYAYRYIIVPIALLCRLLPLPVADTAFPVCWRRAVVGSAATLTLRRLWLWLLAGYMAREGSLNMVLSPINTACLQWQIPLDSSDDLTVWLWLRRTLLPAGRRAGGALWDVAATRLRGLAWQAPFTTFRRNILRFAASIAPVFRAAAWLA
jgi:hypothetical protein